MSVESEIVSLSVINTGTVRFPPFRKVASACNTGGCISSTNGTPVRWSAQRAFSQ